MDFLADLVLYGALGVGVVFHRTRPFPASGPRVTQATILTLVVILGVSLGRTPVIGTIRLVLVAIGSAALLVILTAGIARLLGARNSRSSGGGQGRSLAVFPLAIVGSVLTGYGVSRDVLTGIAMGAVSQTEFGVLLVLLFLVGWEVPWKRFPWRKLAVPLTAAVLGSVIVGPVAGLLSGFPPQDGLAVVCAFGWYSLAGPYFSATVSPALGLFAFLVNFLRENFTMIGSPALAALAGPEGVAASGGATAMDTTLYFVARHGGSDSASMSLAVGVILTLVAPLLLGLLTIRP